MKRVLVVVIALVGLAPAASAFGQVPPPQDFSAGWEFRTDPGDRGLSAGWAAQAPDEGWSEVSVPHTFDARPLEKLFSGTVAWYRKRFDMPDLDQSFSWALKFEQVRRRAVVWLNGRRIGSHADPYTPFELPARGLEPSGNELVVRVDSRKGTRPREGWWNWGGMIRPVQLVPRGRVVLRDVGVLPRVNCSHDPCTAAVTVLATAENRTPDWVRARLRLVMTAPDGAETLASIPFPRVIRAGKTARLRARVPVSGTAALWSPANPQLYQTRVELRTGSRVEQEEAFRTGLRSVRVRDGKLRLNGKPLELYGASIQEDYPGRGAALTDAEMDEIVAQLKELGANATRAHYPLNERLLQRFDEAGIMVWNQAPIYHRNAELDRPEGRREAYDTVRGTVLAGRNHASVMTHSVANEPVAAPDDYPSSARFLRIAAAITRNLDPTLPVSVDILTYPRIARQEAYTHFDLLGINNYYGWYVGKPERPTGNFYDLEPYLQASRERYPGIAMVMTEFGAESTTNGPPSEKGTYEFQSDYINRVLDVVERNEFMGGAIYWTLREFAVKPRWTGGAAPWAEPEPDSIHNKGLIAYDGTKKPAFEVMRERIARALAPPPAPEPAPTPAPEEAPAP